MINIRKILLNLHRNSSLLMLVAVLGSAFMLPVTALASSLLAGDGTRISQIDPDRVQQSVAGVADLTFSELGGEVMIFRPRYSQDSLVFELPIHWNIQPGSAYIDLAYDVIDNTTGGQSLLDVDPGVLEVHVDGIIVGSLVAKTGLAQLTRIELPASAFNSLDSNQHVITLTYTSRVRCTIDDIDPARIVVQADSLLHFEYSNQELVVNLADFPQPIHRSLIEPEMAIIVVPDKYSTQDLEAAAAIAATLGSVTFGELSVNLRLASQVTPELLSSMPVIMLGTPQANTLIADLYERNVLPTTLSADGLIRNLQTGQVAEPEDGVIQEIRSSYNPELVDLILSGATSEGVLLATQALSSLDPRFGLTGSTAIISEAGEFAHPSPEPSTTLTELGLRQETLEEFGFRVSRVSFFVGSNWIFNQNARLNLAYRHSASLNEGASNLNVLLNGVPMASVKLIDATTVTGHALIELPIEDLQPGRNQLTFVANLELEDPCAETTTDVSWVRVMGSSTLDLDYRLVEKNILRGLEDPLTPFYSTLDLSDVWFVLPQEPNTSELESMVQLAWLMGESTGGGGFSPRVSLNTIDESLRDDYHILAIGRPTTNAFINEISPELYQPFVSNEDAIKQEVGNISYRLPDRFSLGVIQSIRAPWNENRAITIVAGTTQEGLEWALRSLVAEEPYTNLTFVGEDRIESIEGGDMLRGSIAIIEDVTGQAIESGDLLATPQATPDISQALPTDRTTGDVDYTDPAGPSTTFLILSIGFIGVGLVIVLVGLLWRRARR